MLEGPVLKNVAFTEEFSYMRKEMYMQADPLSFQEHTLDSNSIPFSSIRFIQVHSYVSQVKLVQLNSTQLRPIQSWLWAFFRVSSVSSAPCQIKTSAV